MKGGPKKNTAEPFNWLLSLLALIFNCALLLDVELCDRLMKAGCCSLLRNKILEVSIGLLSALQFEPKFFSAKTGAQLSSLIP